MRSLFPMLLVLLTLGTGCATTSGTLAALRGRSLLVVAPEGDAPGRDEAELNRALSLLPVRAWPGEADARLGSRLAAAEDRLATARTSAETRRVPWLLVATAEGARVETTRGGKVLWEATLRGRAPAAEQVRDQLLRALVPRGGDPGPLDAREVRLAPAEDLSTLRSLAAEGRWEEHASLLQSALEEWPADPALRVHEGLPSLLSGGGARGQEQARAMNPDGESELLALALSADGAGNRALGLRTRRQLVALHPDRFDYLPELADLEAESGGPEEALRALSAARQAGSAADFERLPSMVGPHDVPDGLPWADLAFAHGWYLAQLERWEQAALSYEEAADLYDRFDRRVELGDTLNNAGVAMVNADRPLIAARTFGRAILVRAGGDPIKAANSRYNQGRAYSDAGKLPQALRTYRTAAREYAIAGEPWEAVDARIESLDLLVRAGDGPGFEAEAADILVSAREQDGPEVKVREAEGDTWFELGKGRLTFRDPSGALEAYEHSLAVWRQLGRRVEEGQTLYSMALPHLALFDFEAAFGDLVAALEISAAVGDSTSIVAIREQLREIQELVRKAGRPVPRVPKSLEQWLD